MRGLLKNIPPIKKVPRQRPNEQAMKRQRTANIVLIVYLLISASGLAFLFLTWNRGPMAGMANGIKILWSFGFVCVLSVAVFAGFCILRAGIGRFAIAIAMLLIWILVVLSNISSSEIRGALAPRGTYYSIEYRNHSNQNIFVDGVGRLNSGGASRSARRVVHHLPSKIVWWNGSAWRKARPSDNSYLVVPPRDLQYGDHVVFALNKDGLWEMSIE